MHSTCMLHHVVKLMGIPYGFHRMRVLGDGPVPSANATIGHLTLLHCVRNLPKGIKGGDKYTGLGHLYPSQCFVHFCKSVN